MSLSGPQPIPSADFQAIDLLRQDVIEGLSARPKRIAPKYFYDRAGSVLFDAICTLPEYYVTRVELDIMAKQSTEMVRRLGGPIRLVEPGAGSGLKTRLLLRALARQCAEYVPVDISREHLFASVSSLRSEFGDVRIVPLACDFTLGLPIARSDVPTVVYFPGSTLGNFEPPEAERLLSIFRRAIGHSGAIILGVDRKKNPAVLHAAYNDAQGVTAAFNRNLLVRINRELGGDFDPQRFDHYAFYNPREGRIEMHLLSQTAQRVSLGPLTFSFSEGESICTEVSYKYDLPQAEALAARSDLRVEEVYSDEDDQFAVLLLRPQRTFRCT